jgi:transposase
MEKATIIGVDLAKHVFQIHGACADGSVAFRKKISRVKLLPFLSSQPRCVVAMEACAGAHSWARDIQAQGHEVRLTAKAHTSAYDEAPRAIRTSSRRSNVRNLPTPALLSAAPRQLRMALDSARLRGMSPSARRTALARLASLLLEAAGVAAAERDDDER